MPEPARRPLSPPPGREPSDTATAHFLRAHFEDVLASLDDGLILLDRERRVVFVSPGAQDLTTVSAAHATGRPAPEAFAAHRWLSDTLESLPRDEVRRATETGELLTRLGRRVTVRVAVSPVVDAAGGVVGTLVLLRDLGGRRSRGAGSETASRAEDLADVAAGLAHEIKNPLGGIKGAAQILAETLAGSPDATRFTSLITREVDRVSALLEQLLELTRPPRLRLAAVNVHRILQEVLLLEEARTGGALTVDCRFDPSLPEVWADEARLRQVLLNLVKNALEAMGRAGRLTITTRIETDFHVRNPGHGRGRRFLSVDIEDTGPGIPAEDLERVFTPFFTTKPSGTGLGLAVSQRLVTEHGGRLRAESEPGRGTRFRVSLPVAAPAGGA
jgi:two-component system nitrogen regulation sensor histidine kinase GlnL